MNDELTALQRQVSGLSRLHQLQKQLRESDSAAQTGFIMVNDSRQLVNYRQAVWWQPGKGVSHASGLVEVDRNAPYVRWCNSLLESQTPEGIRPLTPDQLSQSLRDEWQEFLPAQALLVPVPLPDGERTGILMLARDEPWLDHEIGLLSELADIFRFALRGQRKLPRPQISRLRKRILPVVAVLALIACLIPVRISVLAPAEVVARDAQPVRAPYEGVIEQIHVRPNQTVRQGELLLSLDATDLKNRLAIARQALQIANTEFRQVAQQAVFDEKGKLELAIRRGMVEKSVAEVKYLQSLLQRTEVRASADGIVVLADSSEWIGRPVAMGEQIMTLADPANAELRVDLPVRDAIPLPQQAEVRFFMNISPDQPVAAEMNWLAYKASSSDEGVLAYSGRAGFAESSESLPRIGLRGTARLYGESAPLIYYVLRRPLAAARQWAGI